MQPKRWTVVVAGNYRQFEEWCRDNRINPRMLHEAGVVYASSSAAVMGLDIERLVRTGTWTHQPLDLLLEVESRAIACKAVLA